MNILIPPTGPAHNCFSIRRPCRSKNRKSLSITARSYWALSGSVNVCNNQRVLTNGPVPPHKCEAAAGWRKGNWTIYIVQQFSGTAAGLRDLIKHAGFVPCARGEIEVTSVAREYDASVV